VKGTERACGDSQVSLNDQSLESKWHGTNAEGSDYLDVYGGQNASWTVTCLYDSTPADGSNSDGQDVVHLLSLTLADFEDRVNVPAFTVSYKQISKPAIVRFSPSSIDSMSAREISVWRQPSVEFDLDIVQPKQDEHTGPVLQENLHSEQKSLGSKLKALTSVVKAKVHNAVETLGKKIGCHKTAAQQLPPKPPLMPLQPETSSAPTDPEAPSQPAEPETPQKARPISSIDRLLEWKSDSNDDSSVQHDELEPLDTASPSYPQHDEKTPSTVSHLPAAQTRSFGSPSATTHSGPFLSTPHHTPDFVVVKSLGLALVGISILAWLTLRCRDPRRRADRAAACEERRNKWLYRRAARTQKLKNWVWGLRMKYGLASVEVLGWDEKRARVIEQEAVLEDAMKNDIRALRRAQRVESNISAAEAGRNVFGYEAEGSERRRSVSTLPGYESEENQPPSYEGTTVVDGFQYTPAETEFTPDSSVISTSPRISRDGTNSDFDEKFEAINLNDSRSVDIDH